MMNISANYKVIPLSGTMGAGQLGDGVTASTVHRVYCISPGNVTITAAGGGTFTFTASNANEYVDVVVGSLTVNAGTFIGFKAKYIPSQFGPFS
jgi:hypothetical protein